VLDALSDAAVGVCDGVGAAEPVALGVAVLVGVPEGVVGADAVEESDSVGDDEPVPEVDGVPLAVPFTEMVAVGVALRDGERLCVVELESVPEGV